MLVGVYFCPCSPHFIQVKLRKKEPLPLSMVWFLVCQIWLHFLLHHYLANLAQILAPSGSSILELLLKVLLVLHLGSWFIWKLWDHFWVFLTFWGNQIINKYFEFLKKIKFRALDGIADAAAWGSAVSILMKLFPSKVTTVMSWTETLFGFGYMIGKKSKI